MIPMLQFVPAEWAHDWAPVGIRFWAELFPCVNRIWKPFEWKGLHFDNRLGLAGGADKNADLLLPWHQLGFGFIEVGTVTPRPQGPNPGQILGRDWEQQLLWNRMGFPGEGAHYVRARLATFQRPPGFPVFVNIGKNRTTPNEQSIDDYVLCCKELAPQSDAVVINVSSPNTSRLRDLQEKGFLKKLVQAVAANSGQKPVLVKFSPDEDAKSLKESLEASLEAGAQGFVLTNTTLSRPPHSRFPDVGGLSGAFLASKSKVALRIATESFSHLPVSQRPLLISAGGILSADDIKERLDLGADLVQVYSAMVFKGPGFPNQIARQMNSAKDNP